MVFAPSVEIVAVPYVLLHYFLMCYCIDINEELINRGAKVAAANGVTITPFVQDINFLELDGTFDLVFAHAILHHLVELEHVLDEIKLYLSDEGKIIVYDVTARNGLLLWPTQREVVNTLLKALPSKFRYSHVLKRSTEAYVEIDHSDLGFECIRSQDIVFLLQDRFATMCLVKGFAFLRRFTDCEFGPNFDLTNDSDVKVFNLLRELDEWYVDSGLLRPESVFWVGRRPG